MVTTEVGTVEGRAKLLVHSTDRQRCYTDREWARVVGRVFASDELTLIETTRRLHMCVLPFLASSSVSTFRIQKCPSRAKIELILHDNQ